MTDPRRSIPSVDALLESPAFEPILERHARARVLAVVRAVQVEARSALAAAGTGPEAGEQPPSPEMAGPSRLTDHAWYAEAVAERLAAVARPSLRRVINATGVILHTNLGRAPLAEAARRAVAEAAGYATLEYDVEAGGRGSRHDHCAGLLAELTGAEAALVVNNNAAAVVLALNTLAQDRDAVISRGELVEIGGSFRVPEIMVRSGARMREVGSTNRTHRRDYEAAVDRDTGVILKVHRSNFRVEGFTAEVGLAELAEVAGAAGRPLVADLGSGLLLDLTGLGLPPEPTAAEAVAAGCDLVTMSGDKLLGGPQAGIVAGRAELVARLRANPLCRALRPDKLTLAALEATLALYLDPERALREVPVLRMLAATEAETRARAERLAERLRAAGVRATTAATTSAVGGGAYPGVELPGAAVMVEPGPAGADALAARLRAGEPAVVARVRDARLMLDPRTVAAAEEPALERALAAALSAEDG